MRLLGRPYEKRFSGSWEERIADLFECGVIFEGKSLLDIGCNMGIISYEVSKKNPSLIHGIDIYEPAISVARKVFMGVKIEHRFDVVDITQDKQLQRYLASSYDIILILSVWHHLRRRFGEEIADRSFCRIAEHCRESLIARVPPELADTLGDLMAAVGFQLAYRSAQQRRHLGVFLAFRRQERNVAGSPA